MITGKKFGSRFLLPEKRKDFPVITSSAGAEISDGPHKGGP